MNVILLSGGSGKRLWPVSGDIRAKQFIKILKNEDGSYESMIQRAYRRIKKTDKNVCITIATSEEQVSEIHNQLGDDVCISAEPCRRDTFPAIALATSYLTDVLKINPEEAVVVCPVDSYAEEDYFKALKSLSDIASESDANLVLMGIEPTFPSENYGYIIPETSDNVSLVRTFKEKPSKETAKEYINRGALWNCGVFAYKLKYVLNRAHRLIDFTDYRDLLSKYSTLEKISFDYAVVEHEDKIQVQRFSGQWQDIGTWSTFTEVMDEDIIGTGIKSDSCSGVRILNETNIPVVAIGLHDVIISVSSQGILVSDKEQSCFIKPFVEMLENGDTFAEKEKVN